MIDRIKEIIKHYSLTDSAFAARCGIRQNTIWYQLEGQRKLNVNLVIAILTAFEEISAEWLMRGKGNMIIGDDRNYSDRINSLVDTIDILQKTLSEKNKTIKELQMQLEKSK